AGVDDAVAFDGQQLAVAPQGARAALDALAGNGRADQVVVIRHFERSEAQLAHVARFGRVQLAAFTALQSANTARGGRWRRCWGLKSCTHASSLVRAEKGPIQREGSWRGASNLSSSSDGTDT